MRSRTYRARVHYAKTIRALADRRCRRAANHQSRLVVVELVLLLVYGAVALAAAAAAACSAVCWSSAALRGGSLECARLPLLLLTGRRTHAYVSNGIRALRPSESSSRSSAASSSRRGVRTRRCAAAAHIIGAESVCGEFVCVCVCASFVCIQTRGWVCFDIHACTRAHAVFICYIITKPKINIIKCNTYEAILCKCGGWRGWSGKYM